MEQQPSPLTGERRPLEIIRDTESRLRRNLVKFVYPTLPAPLAEQLQDQSLAAEESWQEVTALEEISDRQLQPQRILVGLTFVGFSALLVCFLLLYLSLQHPGLSISQQIGYYWYQYIFSVCLGVAGMLMLGREAMRSR